MGLGDKKCVPCEGGVPALEWPEIARLLAELGGDWQVVEGHHLAKTYAFVDFVSALAFTNRVGELAEAENHHPDIHLSWGKVRIELWTHAAAGLTENDFILAAKCDRLPRG